MNVKIGKKIKELRKRDSITQERLAEALGLTSQAISKWESENGYPDIEYIMPIANFFNVTTDYLFGYDIKNEYKGIDILFGTALLSANNRDYFLNKFISKIENLREELKYNFNINMPLIRIRCDSFRTYPQ